MAYKDMDHMKHEKHEKTEGKIEEHMGKKMPKGKLDAHEHVDGHNMTDGLRHSPSTKHRKRR